MKVICGLGNPGKEYERTRHNVGWWVLDALARRWGADTFRKDGQSLVATARVGSEVVKLVKPQTYMNASGNALVTYLRKPDFDAARDLLVVVDEVALPLAALRLRADGSAGGHNGLKSVQQHVGSGRYPRLRIGVAPLHPRAAVGDLADFVLSPFGREESAFVEAQLPRMADACECWVRDGIITAMNRFNGDVPAS
ncbi:MAG: aminoacyl-tRNA hydrolase [Gemmatimonadaceae bacterium]|nr:aminoacyl-tRNA hydrolase [Gemmatimonadaceae bacterium]